MQIKPTKRHIDIFLGFFKNNLDQVRQNPDNVEQMFAEYVQKSIQDPNISDFEKGYIAGSSFMGVLESFSKTIELLGKDTHAE